MLHLIVHLCCWVKSKATCLPLILRCVIRDTASPETSRQDSKQQHVMIFPLLQRLATNPSDSSFLILPGADHCHCLNWSDQLLLTNVNYITSADAGKLPVVSMCYLCQSLRKHNTSVSKPSNFTDVTAITALKLPYSWITACWSSPSFHF